VINGKCTDVRKSAVNAVFEEVFGYSLGVNPMAYSRPMVVKSEVNAAHDGRVVQGPISPDEVTSETAYQKLIDNTVSESEVVLDYRVPVINDRIPLIYLKYRSKESRFLNASDHTTIGSPSDVFRPSESKKILELARRMGIEFGELDVLRDRQDGRIYVVDVNPTPWGPPRGMCADDRKSALSRLAPPFDKLIQTYARR